jgi:hypothetical protein
VGSVVHWIYAGGLHFDDAEHLCKIYGLSVKLGIRDLAETCLAKLSNAAHSTITAAQVQGISVESLLQAGQSDMFRPKTKDFISNAVPTVFNYVLDEKNSHCVLHDFAIKTLAETRDIGAFNIIKPRMGRDMAVQLVEALMKQPLAANADDNYFETGYQAEERSMSICGSAEGHRS